MSQYRKYLKQIRHTAYFNSLKELHAWRQAMIPGMRTVIKVVPRGAVDFDFELHWETQEYLT